MVFGSFVVLVPPQPELKAAISSPDLGGQSRILLKNVFDVIDINFGNLQTLIVV